MEVFFTILHRNYIRKNDMEEPPALDDGDSYNNKDQKEIPTHKKHDKCNLEEKYYRYGVQPEWLQIQVGEWFRKFFDQLFLTKLLDFRS